jgi:hypothetical protein
MSGERIILDLYFEMLCKRILKTQQKNYLFHPNMWLINNVLKGPCLGGDFYQGQEQDSDAWQLEWSRRGAVRDLRVRERRQVNNCGRKWCIELGLWQPVIEIQLPCVSVTG